MEAKDAYLTERYLFLNRNIPKKTNYTCKTKRYLQNQKILIWKQKVLMEAKDTYKNKIY